MDLDLGNKKWIFLILLTVVGMLFFSSWGESEDELPDMPKEVDFSYHIQPILSQNCYTCHGNDPAARKAGLRLDIEDDAKSKLESGTTAIVGGSLKRSAMIDRILSDDPAVQMPPPEVKKTLTEREIALLKKWVKQGAKYQDHWAFTKPEMPSLSSELLANVPSTIDHFINEKLDQKNLKASKQASKNELIRRVSYLTTGLPPTIEELSQFLNDDSENAYTDMLDKYLESPGFGERWARHWMDLVRYGDGMGHEFDINISSAYEYRDYLIRAFNTDVPYDLFVKEHLAGDMIAEPRLNPEKGFNESHIGTGYFFLGEGKHSPVDPKVEEADKIDNMIDVTSKTFQAMTVSCAKCHDHKFDPIPTADYYSMYGMIESSRLMPRQGRVVAGLDSKLVLINEIKEDAKKDIISFIKNDERLVGYENDKEVAEKEINIDNDTSAVLLAEFRDGNWDGWYTQGIAFGDGPVDGSLITENAAHYREQQVILQRREFKTEEEYNKALKAARTQRPDDIQTKVLSGFASSRSISPGMQGVLHSPNFIIEHDTIAIRARGLNGTIRVIIDNFQLIQNPLWGGCEKVMNDSEWKTYKLDVHLAKGHKAFLQFLPGKYSSHVYGIESDDYVEVEWAAAYSGDHDLVRYNLAPPTSRSIADDLHDTADNWLKKEVSSDDANRINKLLNEGYPTSKSQDLNNELDLLKDQIFDPTHFIGLSDGDAIQSPIFIRGSHEALSDEKMPHQFLSVMEVGPDFPSEGSGRMAWANAVIDQNNPLTSRVIVNRLWHHLFGKGIVETVDNFGLQGKIPSHPELLDYLALSFVQDGWSMKSMIKNIMLSETFRRSTRFEEESKQIDPDNILLSSFPIRRLESEAIRDGILAVAGCLNDQMYGEGVPVYLSEFMTGRGRPSRSGPLDSYGRRSIYTTVRRNFIPEMMLAFDMPIPFSTFGKRNTTNVPAQSLTLMNSPFVHEQAEYWAQNLFLNNPGSSTEGKIQNIYLRAFSRKASADEISEGLEFLKGQASEKGVVIDKINTDPELWKEYCHAIINFKEFIHLI